MSLLCSWWLTESGIFECRVFGGSPAEPANTSNVSSVSFAVGRQIRKLPFSQLSRPMSGKQATAAVAGSELGRRLRPSSVNWPTGSFRSTAAVRMTTPKRWRQAAIGWLQSSRGRQSDSVRNAAANDTLRTSPGTATGASDCFTSGSAAWLETAQSTRSYCWSIQ